MRTLVLWLFAWAIAFVVGVTGGIVAAVACEVIWTAMFGGEVNPSLFFAGWIAATITWPLSDWLEERFGIAA